MLILKKFKLILINDYKSTEQLIISLRRVVTHTNEWS